MLTFPQMYRHESYPKMNFEHVTGRGSERVSPAKIDSVSGSSETSLFHKAYLWRTALTGGMLGSAHAGLVLCGCVKELMGRAKELAGHPSKGCVGPKPATTLDLVLGNAGHPPRLSSCRGQSECCQTVWHWKCIFFNYFFFWNVN